MVDAHLAHELRELYEKFLTDGDLIDESQLQIYYQNFRGRFGPDMLAGLDGEELLKTMHGGIANEGLNYWLEFKNDEEFASPKFGGIAGGSALKFGIYKRKEDGVWMTGSPGKQVRLSVEEAIDIARKQRDQLVKGAKVLESFSGVSDSDYKNLQDELNQIASDVADTVWGHKYFHLLFSDRLDDLHSVDHQRFHLIKVLQEPPEGEGRYLAAGRFMNLSRELGMHVKHLTDCLYKRSGSPYRYWRIGTTAGSAGEDFWPQMLERKYVAIGWTELGDLSGYGYSKASLERIKSLMAEFYPDYTPALVGRKGREVLNFVAVIAEGDTVLACRGANVLGVGKIKGSYEYDPTWAFGHLRPVDWLRTKEWPMPDPEGLQTTVWPVRKIQNLLETERHISHIAPDELPSLEGVLERVESILKRKGQVILYGPPGTGKTYWALQGAREMAARENFGKRFNSLSSDEQATIINPEHESKRLVRICTFHPSYGYEDFLEGYRPQDSDQGLAFTLKSGIFKVLCNDARENPNLKFFLVIDEINRGDIPRIFGELLTIMEKDKRGQAITLPISGEPLQVPENVFIMGTMNTADRSIALLDKALRRRFGFVELMPNYSLLGGTALRGIPLGPWLQSLNKKIIEHVGRDARNLQIGHAYLLDDGKPVSDFSRFVKILREDIIPLLEEYCYEDFLVLEAILGKELVDTQRQRINETVFDPSRRDDLIQALLNIDPELTSSRDAQEAQAEPEDQQEEEDEDNE